MTLHGHLASFSYILHFYDNRWVGNVPHTCSIINICIWHLLHMSKITCFDAPCRGLTYSALRKYFQLADVQWMSKTLFYDYQHSHMLPVIKQYFNESLQSTRETLIESGMHHQFIICCHKSIIL